MSLLQSNPPSARHLMNSMRSMGYSFESAVADIIDNSITAKATQVILSFPTDPNYCFVSICDNGYGMSKYTLYEAMKYGSAVNEVRDSSDLGRFGLGLKSASLSQCKKLTVVSKFEGKLNSFAWDIDLVGEDWLIQELSDEEIEELPNISTLKNFEHGTLVIWENFDTIEKSTGFVFTTLSEYMDSTANYLSLIFHRFLNGEANIPFSIKVNNYELKGLDPFLEKHNKTNHRKEIYIPIKDSEGVEQMVIAKPFVLPFQKDLSKEDQKLMGGIDSYSTKQGFYVYRNLRLIIWGTWFRMRPRNELTKHARIRVDIPNSLDDIWCIDIKKQNAVLPNSCKHKLIKAVEEAMDIAVKAQRFRGRIDNPNSKIEYIWNKMDGREGKKFYKINRSHRLFDLLDNVNDADRNKFEIILDEIEQNIPYQQIYLDMCDHVIDDVVDDERINEIENEARLLIHYSLKISSQSKEEIIEKLFNAEPFCKYPNIKKKIIEE